MEADVAAESREAEAPDPDLSDALADQLGFESARRQYLKELTLSGNDSPEPADLMESEDARTAARTMAELHEAMQPREPEPDRGPEIEP